MWEAVRISGASILKSEMSDALMAAPALPTTLMIKECSLELSVHVLAAGHLPLLWQLPLLGYVPRPRPPCRIFFGSWMYLCVCKTACIWQLSAAMSVHVCHMYMCSTRMHMHIYAGTIKISRCNQLILTRHSITQ